MGCLEENTKGRGEISFPESERATSESPLELDQAQNLRVALLALWLECDSTICHVIGYRH